MTSHGDELRERQRLALLSLVRRDDDSGTGSATEKKKKKRGPPTWSTQLRGWSPDSSVPPCEWDGVTCRAADDGGGGDHDVVTGVNVTGRGLSGTVPSELGLLTELEELMLGNNMLRGSIPEEVAELGKLRTLDLTRCFLTGTLPRRFGSRRLTRLLLADNAISGRFFRRGDGDDGDDEHGDDSAPRGLRSLREIRMENNLLTGTLHGPSIAGMMPGLEILSLSDNDLSGLVPGELGSLPELRYLYLDSNHFVGPMPGQLAQIGRASILELWLQDNALSGTVPASYTRFYQLHDFFVDGNKLTGALPPDLCGPMVNADFFADAPNSTDQRNWCDSIACPAGSVALEGMYPCTECPGGEAARLKNRYLGQTGECSDHTQRQILESFHDATTKGGPWSGVDDWKHERKPVCEMTGITCDAQGHVVGISLRDRNLQGHIPDQVGLLTFLETLDVSDNALVGYLPGDLRWTSLTRLDVSGNKLRGMIPPLLCKMEELNGNGEGNVFHCDRIACPAGTSNDFGFRHGADGEECTPCYDESPYIAQKTCRVQQPPKADWKDAVKTVAKETSGRMGVSAIHALAIASGALFLVVAICCLACRRRRSRKERYEAGDADGWDDASSCDGYSAEGDDDEGEERLPFVDAGHEHFRRRNSHGCEDVPAGPGDERYGRNRRGDYDADEYPADEPSFEHSGVRDNSRYRTPVYRDLPEDEDFYESDDDANAPWARRSASDFVRQHQGIALNRRERLQRSVSERLSGTAGGLDRRARETASAVNVVARRRWHAHIAG